MLDEIVSEFLVESYESLDRLDRDLMALEETPGDRERMSSIFRTIHTIKGTSGFLAFPRLEKVAHVGESLLVPLRDGELTLTQDIANNLLAMVDAVRSILGNIENNGNEGENSYDDLIRSLEQLKTGDTAAKPAGSTEAGNTAEIPVESVIQELTAGESQASGSEAASETLNLSETQPAAASPKKSRGSKTPKAAQKSPKTAAKPRSKSSGKASAKKPAAADVAASAQSVAAGSANSKSAPAGEPGREVADRSDIAGSGVSVTESSVRIDVNLLDKLMNLVGELVLARNQIMQFSQVSSDPALAAAAQRVNLITTELQEGVMKTRMQPIRNAWSKLPRVVRDLAQQCEKRIQVKMEGADTELDKTILEAIKDPLTHIVRNSVDHGIESPADRKAAGKSPEGTLLLRAFHEGGQVNIEIIDDGGGINTERVRRIAVDKKLISAEQAAVMSDREAMQLILLPGFSTAAKVTNVSGRGVGMDVVKTNVEKIGGTLDIQSQPGLGTTLRIKIPLTLAIVPALVVTCEEGRYCIPQVNLLELVRLEGDRVKNEIEVLHSVPVYRLRGQLLPLVYLDEQLQLREARTAAGHHSDEAVNIVVLQAEDRQFGLVVNQINDTQEIVVKPLGSHLKGLPTYAGSTIMGDGSVALILDVIGIARKGHVLTERASRQFMDANAGNADARRGRGSYLIVDPGDGTRAAILLSTVSRLEEICATEIERNGSQHVVQYRGEIMPLISLSDYGGIDVQKEVLSLVVYNTGGRTIGVVVEQIVDIVEEALGTSDSDSSTRVIAGRVTRMVDLEQLAAAV